jgi:hypothetical protein
VKRVLLALLLLTACGHVVAPKAQRPIERVAHDLIPITAASCRVAIQIGATYQDPPTVLRRNAHIKASELQAQGAADVIDIVERAPASTTLKVGGHRPTWIAIVVASYCAPR